MTITDERQARAEAWQARAEARRAIVEKIAQATSEAYYLADFHLKPHHIVTRALNIAHEVATRYANNVPWHGR